MSSGAVAVLVTPSEPEHRDREGNDRRRQQPPTESDGPGPSASSLRLRRRESRSLQQKPVPWPVPGTRRNLNLRNHLDSAVGPEPASATEPRPGPSRARPGPSRIMLSPGRHWQSSTPRLRLTAAVPLAVATPGPVTGPREHAGSVICNLNCCSMPVTRWQHCGTLSGSDQTADSDSAPPGPGPGPADPALSRLAFENGRAARRPGANAHVAGVIKFNFGNPQALEENLQPIYSMVTLGLLAAAQGSSSTLLSLRLSPATVTRDCSLLMVRDHLHDSLGPKRVKLVKSSLGYRTAYRPMHIGSAHGFDIKIDRAPKTSGDAFCAILIASMTISRSTVSKSASQ
jgi:hypothetical protein